MTDGEILKNIAIVAPAKPPTKKTKKGIVWHSTNKLIPHRAKRAVKQRIVLDNIKYSPRAGHPWKHRSAHFPSLYKALLAGPDQAARRAILKSGLQVLRK